MSSLFLRSLLLPLICVLALAPWSHGLSQGQQEPSSLYAESNTVRYHGGPLLTNSNGVNVYLIWYGGFSLKDRSSITDFFASFGSPGSRQGNSVSTWWRTISTYKDKAGRPVSNTVRLVKQVDVTVERFCMGSCGFHDSISIGAISQVVFGHVGDPKVQCPGAASNPFKTGYFQGDALAPLEAVTACPRIFGSGAYLG
ncbi:Fumarase 1 isoform 1 [Hibiscus syriacus]|uniref:Fumarase 1 isoform 1 n=1 Tax=Hibiscus syriacus TaxID=106335 RepID=A0A6A2YQR8_HIBSY|nr:Fumarase 1 isoform 1 [Hibiscus syriacus]